MAIGKDHVRARAGRHAVAGRRRHAEPPDQGVEIFGFLDGKRFAAEGHFGAPHIAPIPDDHAAFGSRRRDVYGKVAEAVTLAHTARRHDERDRRGRVVDLNVECHVAVGAEIDSMNFGPNPFSTLDQLRVEIHLEIGVVRCAFEQRDVVAVRGGAHVGSFLLQTGRRVARAAGYWGWRPLASGRERQRAVGGSVVNRVVVGGRVEVCPFRFRQ